MESSAMLMGVSSAHAHHTECPSLLPNTLLLLLQDPLSRLLLGHSVHVLFAPVPASCQLSIHVGRLLLPLDAELVLNVLIVTDEAGP